MAKPRIVFNRACRMDIDGELDARARWIETADGAHQALIEVHELPEHMGGGLRVLVRAARGTVTVHAHGLDDLSKDEEVIPS